MGLNGRIASLSHTTTQSSAHALTPPPITLVSALMAGIVKGACHIIGSLPATIATAGPWLRKGRSSKALLIGINYSHVHQEGWKLGGPHLEVMVFRDLLIRHYGVPADNIVVMIDAKIVNAQLQPTSENIKRELQRFHNPYERALWVMRATRRMAKMNISYHVTVFTVTGRSTMLN
ncbi:hypothetical protein P691DRAFT_334335 [Macrolepiota fuliginosa MF-IS2]|uniref:Uncharacterized protein n=1 Tax=Macrolepiota fuliginosa MF-IS2 TaxID=1400762 RepID=A0A9P6C0G1_9AGAR|nr:hypothetical protein P691DRAFT_334335 [Macrolepiota fuliginosa MF-IS2]